MNNAWLLDLATARDVNVAESLSTRPLFEVEAWWKRFPYGHDGDGHRILSVSGCLQRGYGSCGDAAASLLGAAMRQGIVARLCIEEPPWPRDYKHVRVVTASGDVYDPYASLRPQGLAWSCDAWWQG